MTPHDPSWSLIIPHDPLLSLMIPHDPSWSLIIPHDPSWSLMTPHDPSWSKEIPKDPWKSLVIPSNPSDPSLEIWWSCDHFAFVGEDINFGVSSFALSILITRQFLTEKTNKQKWRIFKKINTRFCQNCQHKITEYNYSLISTLARITILIWEKIVSSRV